MDAVTPPADSRHKLNNFDLVRLVAALGVLLTHAHALTGFLQTETVVIWSGGQLSFGQLGVFAFFFTSGFLLFMSWDRDPNFIRFAANRFLRVIPGLAAIVIITVFIVGPAVSAYPTEKYFSLRATYVYLLNIKLFPLRHELPGCFLRNPYPGAVNGSLWTIPYEVDCYLLLVLLAAVGAIRRRLGPLVLWLTTVSLAIAISHSQDRFGLPVSILGVALDQYLYFLSYFWAGVLFSQYRSRIPPSILLTLAALALLAAANRFGLATEGFALMFPYVLYVAAHLPGAGRLNRWATRQGDLSYGIYLSGFMIQQMLVQWLPAARRPMTNFALTAIASGLYAVLSWRFVESRALNLKRARVLHRRWIDRCSVRPI